MTTKAEIRAALEVLETLEQTNKGSAKTAILRENKGNTVLKTLVEMAIGQDRYNIRPSEDLVPTSDSKLKIVTAYERFLSIAEQLKTRQLTGKKATKKVEGFLTSLYPVPKKWFTRVLNKNLRIGVSEKTIRSSWGSKDRILGEDERIIFFKDKCPLAEKISDLVKKKSWKGIDYGEEGWISEPKLDGDRALLFFFPSSKELLILTRGGKRWRHIEGCHPFVDRVEALHKRVSPCTGFGESTPMLYDGEFIARSGSWNETSSIVRSHKNFNKERFLSRVRILLWDWCPLRFFNEGLFPLPLKERKYVLMKSAGLKKSTAKLTKIVEGIYIVGHTVVYSDEEMWADNARKLAAGYEGSLLKNPEAHMVMKRSADYIKVKPEDQDTGTIVKCVSGKGKNARAKESDIKKIRREMKKWGEVADDGYYFHCEVSSSKVSGLVRSLRSVVNDSNDRRISTHKGNSTVSYRYSERLGYFVVKTDKGERIRVGGKMTHKAGNDQRMDYWMRRKELVGVKVDFLYQGGCDDVAKARFNKFYRLREDL